MKSSEKNQEDTGGNSKIKMPTVGILGEESFDHGGAWTERIAEPKFDAKKQVTVDLQQNR
jgi:hypothetical protein